MGQNSGTKQDSYLSAALRCRLETLREELPGSVRIFKPARRSALDIPAVSRKRKAEGGNSMLFILTPDLRILPLKSRRSRGRDLRYAPES